MKPAPTTKPCPHCAGTVAQTATKCPHCGGSLRTPQEILAFVIIALFILALIAGAIQEAKFNDAMNGLNESQSNINRLLNR